ncbi:MAG: thiamine phosphate synthase [Armatimonadetes bacterium]|nr:thiamine phosphate synthase [Armatimonadota bacterium]
MEDSLGAKNGVAGIYVVTDSVIAPGRSHTAIAEAAVAGGAACVQLREKRLPDYELLSVAFELRKVTQGSSALFIVNDRPDIAALCGADGVHVGQSDAGASEARNILGADAVVGVSVANVEEALRAEAEGASYVAVGSIFPTSTKSDAGDALRLQAITEIRRAVKVQQVAIGGINLSNIASVAAAGADAAAVVSAVVCADDMAEAVRMLAAEFERGLKLGGQEVDTT